SLAVATATTPLRYTTPTPPAHPRLWRPGPGGAPEPTGPSLPPQRCYASLTRPAYRRPLTPPPLPPLGQQPRGRPTAACPPRIQRTPRARTPQPPSGAHAHQCLRSTQPPQKRGTNRTNRNTTPANGQETPAWLTGRFI